MKIKNLLDFLNNVKALYAQDYATIDTRLVNILDLISQDEQFTQKINLGLVYLDEKTLDSYTIVDGLNRILSLSLLLHAVCECYKKTTEQNEKAIRTIRKKYLLSGTKTKLRMPKEMQVIYEKIIYGERLSGREKEHPMFILLHRYWTQIKEEQLKASNIFNMLQKINIILVDDVENAIKRDLYHSLNNNSRKLNQILLIEDYLKDIDCLDSWNDIKELYQNKDADLILFLRDYYWNKFNFKEFKESGVYEYFVNYFETINKYTPAKNVIEKIKRSAFLYFELLNISMQNENIKKQMINIKMHKGEDTYAYLLSVYEDYVDGNITEVTFMEILSTIDDYLKNRLNTPNNVGFNELVQYLNAFIAYK